MSSYDLERFALRDYNIKRSDSPLRLPSELCSFAQSDKTLLNTVSLSAICKETGPYHNGQDILINFPWRQGSPELSTYDFTWNRPQFIGQESPLSSHADCSLTEDGSNALSPHIASTFEPTDYTNPNSFPGSPREPWVNVDDMYIPPEYNNIPFSNGGSSALLHVAPYQKIELGLHLPPALPSQNFPSFPEEVQSRKRKSWCDGQEDEDCRNSEEDVGSDYAPQQRKKSKASRLTRKSKLRRNGPPCSHIRYDATRPCSQCTQNNKQGLVRPTNTNQNRLFACTFRIYGCNSTFGSKNEWKRHVATKHLETAYWRCDRGRCIPTKPNDNPKDFNRKDLFIQHIRRMHMPAHAKDKEELDASIDSIARQCYHHVRDPPPQSICGFCYAEGRKEDFIGPSSWEHRMEHVGKHLESPGSEHRPCHRDRALEDWLLKEDLIVGDGRDGYMLTSLLNNGKSRH